jgi:hypothetical protein
MPEEVYWDNDEREEGEPFGIPVIAVLPEICRLDYEWLLLSLAADHAKVILIRHFGLRGKKAAKAAGFSSEWSLYRREHDLRKALERQREQFVG